MLIHKNSIHFFNEKSVCVFVCECVCVHTHTCLNKPCSKHVFFGVRLEGAMALFLSSRQA